MNSPLTRGEKDYTNLLKTLDAKYEIIKQLSAVLKGLPSGETPLCHPQFFLFLLFICFTEKSKLIYVAHSVVFYRFNIIINNMQSTTFTGPNDKSSVNDYKPPCVCGLAQNLKNLGTEGSQRLQSGPVLQNVPVTMSISKAVQRNCTALPIEQENALVERTPEMPVVPSQQCTPSAVVVLPHRVTESHKRSKDEMLKDVITKKSKMADCAPCSPNSSKDVLSFEMSKDVIPKKSKMADCTPSSPNSNSSKDVSSKTVTIIERKVRPVQLTQTVAPKHTPVRQTTKEKHPNLIQNFPSHLIDMGLDIHFEIQYQKQTSSQLMAFLKSNGKANFITLLTFIRRELGGSERGEAQTYLMKVPSGQINTGSTAEPEAKVAPTSSPKMKQVSGPPDVKGPVFKVKCVNDGTLIYTCIIATHTELWDISDICTGVSHALSEAQSIMGSGPFFPEQVVDLGNSPDPEMPPASHQGEEEESDGEFTDSEVELGSGRGSSFAIPPFQIRKFEEMAVVVTHVVDPDHFYIQHQDSKVTELSSKME